MKSSIHVSLDVDMLKKFTNLTNKSNVSRNSIVSKLIKEWIEDQEDLIYAQSILNDVKSGTEEVLSHEDMWKSI